MQFDDDDTKKTVRYGFSKENRRKGRQPKVFKIDKRRHNERSLNASIVLRTIRVDLNLMFDNRLISRNAKIASSSRSPNLDVCDFFYDEGKTILNQTARSSTI